MSNPQYHVKYWKMPESWNSKGLTKKARFIPQTMANLVGGGGERESMDNLGKHIGYT